MDRPLGRSIARLPHLSGAAVSTLGKIMLDATTPPSVRVRAADSILNHAAKVIEIENIEERVAEIEEAIEHANPGGKRKLRVAS
jgi:hypothetical protein